MSLLYKPDWEETKARYGAWWAHEYLGRCALAVTARRDGAPEEPKPIPPEEPEVLWTDLDYWARRREWEFRRTFYGGEAFPVWHAGYPGHTSIAVFLGCPITLAQDTGWVDPIVTGEDLDISPLQIDREGRWWQFALRLLSFAAETSRGKAIPSIGAFGGCGDTLAALRGSDRLLYDLVDRPDQVRVADTRLMADWIEVYSRFHTITCEAAEGSTCWFDLWSPGKFYAAQNDFAYMISPKMFRDLFLSAIDTQTRFLDHTVYHVDGVGNFVHVDALCELPRLQAIQILPGTGKPSPLHYLDVLRKVQAAGKDLWIRLEPREIRGALSELSARGLFIETHCETEDEARVLLKSVERWSCDRG